MSIFKTITIRILRIRRQYNRGVVASAVQIDENGEIIIGTPRISLFLPDKTVIAKVDRGQWWRISGFTELNKYTIDGFIVQELRVVAREAELIRPSGEHLIHFLSTSILFPGIGEVRAQRMWEHFGEDLYDILDEGDVEALKEVVKEKLARTVIHGWSEFKATDALRWFQKVGLDLCLVKKLLSVYEDNAVSAIQADPYRLLGFGMSWKNTDLFAQKYFGISENDERRLAAAVEAVLSSEFEQGHTWSNRCEVEKKLASLVGSKHASLAILVAMKNNHILCSGTTLQAFGPALIERTVSQALRSRLDHTCSIQDNEVVELSLAEFQADEGIILTPLQKHVVRTAVDYPLVLVCGGAGTGKTTTLKAVNTVLEQANFHIYQMSLSGRAAKRMSEATSRPAMTIASFLQHIALKGISSRSVVIIDEASMLDIILFYKIIRLIPDATRLILLGDPYQLSPIGPGLVLQCLHKTGIIPTITLRDVKRHGREIAAIAREIKEGRWPTISSNLNDPVVFIHCDNIANKILKLYKQDPKNTQVLTFTREKGSGSSRHINRLCQLSFANHSDRLFVLNLELNRLEDSGFRLGEPLICNRNLWSLGIQNGSLGWLSLIENEPVSTKNEQGKIVGDTLGWIDWDDGMRRPITYEILDSIELAYAITVHKSQGSQFNRVVIAVSPSFNLDRTLIYTAITRAVKQVIFVGDMSAVREAVLSPPFVTSRRVLLDDYLGDKQCL